MNIRAFILFIFWAFLLVPLSAQNYRDRVEGALEGVIKPEFSVNSVGEIVTPYAGTDVRETVLDSEKVIEDALRDKTSDTSIETRANNSHPIGMRPVPHISSEVLAPADAAIENAESIAGGYFSADSGICTYETLEVIPYRERFCASRVVTNKRACFESLSVDLDRLDRFECRRQSDNYVKVCNRTFTEGRCDTGLACGQSYLTSNVPYQLELFSGNFEPGFAVAVLNADNPDWTADGMPGWEGHNLSYQPPTSLLRAIEMGLHKAISQISKNNHAFGLMTLARYSGNLLYPVTSKSLTYSYTFTVPTGVNISKMSFRLIDVPMGGAEIFVDGKRVFVGGGSRKYNRGSPPYLDGTVQYYSSTGLRYNGTALGFGSFSGKEWAVNLDISSIISDKERFIIKIVHYGARISSGPNAGRYTYFGSPSIYGLYEVSCCSAPSKERFTCG